MKNRKRIVQYLCFPALLLLPVLFARQTDQPDPQQSQQSAEDSQQQPSQTAARLETTYPVELDYLIYLPEDYESSDSWPLLLFLHGAGERGDDIEKVKVHGPPKLIEQGKSFPLIVVSPQCPRQRYWEPLSLSALLDDIETRYKVDKQRIYVSGLSMGGFGTWTLATHSPERFAAIAPICGGGDRFVGPRQIHDQMGIWVFHGRKDRVVPFDRSQEMVDGFKTRDVEIKFTAYDEAGHDSWTQTYENEELYTWLLSHQRR